MKVVDVPYSPYPHRGKTAYIFIVTLSQILPINLVSARQLTFQNPILPVIFYEIED